MTTAMPADEFAVTPDEEKILDRYNDATSAIPDTFDGLTHDEVADAHLDADVLRAHAHLLRQWWDELDRLDADLGLAPTRGAALARDVALIGWFDARADLLRAVARHAGIDVPRPEGVDDTVTTSNRSAGHVGFHPAGS